MIASDDRILDHFFRIAHRLFILRHDLPLMEVDEDVGVCQMKTDESRLNPI